MNLFEAMQMKYKQNTYYCKLQVKMWSNSLTKGKLWSCMSKITARVSIKNPFTKVPNLKNSQPNVCRRKAHLNCEIGTTLLHTQTDLNHTKTSLEFYKKQKCKQPTTVNAKLQNKRYYFSPFLCRGTKLSEFKSTRKKLVDVIRRYWLTEIEFETLFFPFATIHTLLYHQGCPL